MDEALIENWNNTVKKDNELVYVLGDFAFCGKQYMTAILSQLRGKKILVKGNHDPKAHVMLECGFDEVVENDRIKIGNHNVLISHFPYHPVTQHFVSGDNRVQQSFDQEVDDRYLHKRILDDGKTFLLHGHVHTAWKVKGRMINVGVDQWNMKPVGHERLLEIIEGKRND